MSAFTSPSKSRRRIPDSTGVTSLKKLGTTWKVQDGEVVVLHMYDHTFTDPVVGAGVKAWNRQGFTARMAVSDDFPPVVPEGMVILHIPLAKFDAFVEIFRVKMDEEHQYIYATIEDVWAHENGEVDYFEDLPVGKALLATGIAY